MLLLWLVYAPVPCAACVLCAVGVRLPRGGGVGGSGKMARLSERAYRDIYIPTQNYFPSPYKSDGRGQENPKPEKF